MKAEVKQLIIFVLILLAITLGSYAILGIIADLLDTNPILLYKFDSDSKTYTVVGCKNADGQDIVIPESYRNYPVASIDEYAFHKEDILSVTLPSTIKRIGEGAFAECRSLKAVYGLENCDEILQVPKYAFYTCHSLESIKLPKNLVYIGEQAFVDCLSLKNIESPLSVKTIDFGAFVGCTDLSKIILTENIVKIHASFGLCSSLQDITIPSSVKELHSMSFAGCSKMENIYVDDDNTEFTSINGVVYSKSKDVLWIYPSGRKDEYFELPNGVTVIAAQSITYNEHLVSLYIPQSVRLIATESFFDSTNLSAIYYAGIIEEWFNMEKEFGWDEGLIDYTIYCTDGQIAKDGTITYK